MLAQLVEHRTFNPRVAGSIPARPTILFEESRVKHVVNIIIIVAAMAFVSIAVAAKYEIDTIKETVVAHDHIVK